MTRAILMLCLLAGAAYAQKPNEARYDQKGALDEDAQVRLEHVAGKVFVRAGTQGEFKVAAVVRVLGVSDEKAKERLAKVKVEIAATPKSLIVKTVYEQQSTLESLAQLFRSRDEGVIEVEYDVTLPHKPKVEVESVSGDVQIEARYGHNTVKTVSGAIVISSCEQSELRSVSGPIEIKEPRASWTAESVSGSVDVELDHNGHHEGKATTTSGAITVLAHPKADIKVTTSTVSGAVTNEIGDKGSKSVELKSVSGAITAKRRGN